MPPEVALIFPPFLPDACDSFYPALPVLSACLKKEGIATTQIDLNREFLKFLLADDFLKPLLLSHEKELARLNQFPFLTGKSGQTYFDLYLKWLVLGFLVEKSPDLKTSNGAPTLYYQNRIDLRQFLNPLFQGIYLDDQAYVTETLAQNLEKLRATDAPVAQFLKGVHQFLDPGQYGLIGITVPMGPQIVPSLLLAQILKANAPQTHICLGGPAMSLLQESALKTILKTGLVDTIYKFEGEPYFAKLCQAVFRKDDLSQVPSIAYLNKQGLHVNDPFAAAAGRLKTTDFYAIDQSPRPDYPEDVLALYPESAIPLIQSRGCYYGKCAYCDYTHIYGKNRYREKSPQKLLDEIEYFCQQGRTHFEFVSESLSPKYIERFHQESRKRDLKISWSAYIRVDKRLTGTHVRYLEASGCKHLTIGLESGSDKVLSLACKGYTAAEAEQFLDLFKDSPIQISVNVIADLPSSRFEEAENTFQIVEKRKAFFYSLTNYSFSLTRSSQMAQNPEAYGLELLPEMEATYKQFSLNQLNFKDLLGMTPAEKQQVFARFEALEQEIAGLANQRRQISPEIQSQDRPADIESQSLASRYQFFKDTVIYKDCRYQLAALQNKAPMVQPSKTLALYNLRTDKLLALQLPLKPLIEYIAGLEYFTLEDIQGFIAANFSKLTPGGINSFASSFIDMLQKYNLCEKR